MRKGKLKKAAALLLSLVMVLSVSLVSVPGETKAAGKTTFTLSADKQDLKRGDEVTVKLNMSENTEAYGVGYTLLYDVETLEVLSYELGEAADDAMVKKINNPVGKIKCAIAADENPVKNGTVMQMKFKVLDTAAAGAVKFEMIPDVSAEYGDPLETVNLDNTNLKVVIPAANISIQKSLTLAKGSTEKLTAVLTPADSNSTVTWKSSNPAAAAVSEDGTVTAKAVGKADITATANGKSAVCAVTVNNPLNSISIEGTASVIKKGTTAQLKVIYNPDDTTDSKEVTWKSSNPSVAEVDKNGLVTAIADGTAVITATVGTKSAAYDIEVKEVKLVSISIKESTTIHRGEDETLTVTYNPADTTDSKNVTWSSSDETIVKVDANGKVTALGLGEANVTAEVGNFKALCKVTVDAPLTAITPEKTAVNLVKNQTAEIRYTLNPADTTDSKKVEFTSSDSKIASVDENGVVTAKKAGNAIITLTGANNITAEVSVTVTEIPVNKVVLDKVNATIEKGASAELTASVNADTTDGDKTITWTSSDESIVTVSKITTNSGEKVVVAAADKGGRATITATAWNGTKAECEILVPIHLEGIQTPAAVSLLRGKTTVLGVEYNPENTTDAKTVTWTSDNESVAAVDAVTGKITAVKAGTANITATADADANLTSTTTVTVQENHMTPEIGADIAFDKISDALLKGQTLDMYSVLNLKKLIEENQITDDIYINWLSADEKIAVIDQNGVLTGVKEGKAAITAEITAVDADGNVTGSYKVTTELQVKEIPLESIAFDKVITEMTVGQVDWLKIIYNPGNTTDLRDVVWTSSNADVVSVEGGKITALKAGTAEITAKVGNKTVTCKITVKSNSTGSGSTPGDNKGQGGGINTGDMSNVGFYIPLLMMAVAAFVTALRKRTAK